VFSLCYELTLRILYQNVISKSSAEEAHCVLPYTYYILVNVAG
jgi:hypothetical protein